MTVIPNPLLTEYIEIITKVNSTVEEILVQLEEVKLSVENLLNSPNMVNVSENGYTGKYKKKKLTKKPIWF